jgi:hypothetical protein
MFTVFVDDSGTAPDQPVAIAGALIIPARQILSLERDWEAFRSKFDFTFFHSSECAARNNKSEFANWDEGKVQKAFMRARQIIKKRTSAACVFAVHKEDFDAVAPAEWYEVGGQNHYISAFRILLTWLMKWHGDRKIAPLFEFVFDRAEGKDKKDIEMLMAQYDALAPGLFLGHYSFRDKKDVPGLQCADILAWTGYGMARLAFRSVPINKIADESFYDFSEYLSGNWMNALSITKEALRDAFADAKQAHGGR